MEIFLDTADTNEIRFWTDQGVIDGVTTNPSIMLAAGHVDLRVAARDLAALLGDRPLSVEVVSDDPAEMLAQGREFASWAENIVVKIPVETSAGRPCLGVVRALNSANIRVNVTACLSFGQALLAAKAGATYVSLFAGRISDEGNDPKRVISMTAEWLVRWGYEAKIIVGSIREAINIQDAASAGAHVITIPPKFLAQLADHRYSRATVEQFLRDGADAQKRLAEIVSSRLLTTGVS
jgi:transaldolase